jgi:sarcosine oxidase, subunit beta
VLKNDAVCLPPEHFGWLMAWTLVAEDKRLCFSAPCQRVTLVDMAHAVVIGAGIIGSSIAHQLANRGHQVTVLDKGPAAGAGSTSSSSAIIRFSYSTWAGVVTSWESMFHWRDWAEHLGLVDPAGMARFFRTGKLVLDTPDGNRDRVLALWDQAGIPYEVWDAATIRARVPALDPSAHFPPKLPSDDRFWDDARGDVSGYFCPDAGFVDDPQLAAHNLMVAAKAAGASFQFRRRITAVLGEGDRVSGVEVDGAEQLEADIVVNAAGPYSAAVNKLAGVLDDFTISTRAFRQEVHTAAAPAHFSLDDGGVVVADGDLGTYFRPHPGGTVLVSGVEAACDPVVWVDDPDVFDEHPSAEMWEAHMYRLARRLPELTVPPQPRGLAALYDVSDDWIPIYDRTALVGFYVAIGTSGNQFKNAPMVGVVMAELIDACEGGSDHDTDPVQVVCPYSGHTIDLGHYSRRRPVNPDSTFSVWG